MFGLLIKAITAYGRKTKALKDYQKKELSKFKEKKDLGKASARFMSSLIMFLEVFPAFLAFLYTSILALLIMSLTVSVLSASIFVTDIAKDVITDYIGGSDIQSGSLLDGVAWSEQELATRGVALTNQEKNIYRLIMLVKNHIEQLGYEYPRDSGLMMATKFSVGLFSIESSGVFYMNGADTKNILHDMTDKVGVNSAGYTGCFGQHYTKTMNNYNIPSDYATKIRSKYVPSSNVIKTRAVDPSFKGYVKSKEAIDPLYAPYASASIVSEMKIKRDAWALKKGELRPQVKKDLYALMNDYGIKNQQSRDDVEAFVVWALASAGYHGTNEAHFKSYMTFWVAMYAMTSDDETKRTYDAWAYGSKGAYPYAESAIRKLITGKVAYSEVGDYATPLTIPKPDTSNVYMTLNGKKLDSGLWTTVYAKYKDKQSMKDAWAKMKAISNHPSNGTSVCVLNYHYGLNSYIQGSHMIDAVANKLVGVASASNQQDVLENFAAGNFKTTPGKGQGVWAGKDITSYVKQSNVSSYVKTKALNLQPHWGTAKIVKPQFIFSRNGVVYWKPDKWGVPYYRQARDAETYANLAYGGSGKPFSAVGCPSYAYAYVASAMTGRLINPAEMVSAFYASGSVDSGNSPYRSAASNNALNALGLKTEWVYLSGGHKIPASASTFESAWRKVDATLDRGGMVVVRGASPFAAGDNHWFAITGVKIKDGKRMYTMYSSSRSDQSTKLWDKSAFKKALHVNLSTVSR